MRAHSIQVESTIMQMYHQRVIFHAKGFFCINYETMLQVNGNSFVILFYIIPLSKHQIL